MSSPPDRPTLYQPIESIDNLENGDKLCDTLSGTHRTIEAVETDSILFADGERVPHMTVIISMVHLRAPSQLWELPESVAESCEADSSTPTTVSPDSPGRSKPRYSGVD